MELLEVINIVYLILVAIFSLTVNIVIITTVCKSSSLSAQVNKFLVSLCVNGLFLVLTIISDIVIILDNSYDDWILFIFQVTFLL